MTDLLPPVGDPSAHRASDAAAALVANLPLLQALLLSADEMTLSAHLVAAGGDPRRAITGFLALVRNGFVRLDGARDGEALFVRQGGAGMLARSLTTLLSALPALPARQTALRGLFMALQFHAVIKPEYRRLVAASLLPATKAEIVAKTRLGPDSVEEWMRGLSEGGLVTIGLDGTVSALEISIDAVRIAEEKSSQHLLQALRPGRSDGVPDVPTGTVRGQIRTVLHQLQARGLVATRDAGWELTSAARRLVERIDDAAGVTGRLLRLLSGADVVTALRVLAGPGSPDEGVTPGRLEELAGLTLSAATLDEMVGAFLLERRTDGIVRLPGGPGGPLARAAVAALAQLAAFAEPLERAVPSSAKKVTRSAAPTRGEQVESRPPSAPGAATRPTRRAGPPSGVHHPLSLLGEPRMSGRVAAYRVATVLEDAAVAAGPEDTRARTWVSWDAILAQLASKAKKPSPVQTTLHKLVKAGLVEHHRAGDQNEFALTPGGRDLLRRAGDIATQVRGARGRTRAGVFSSLAAADVREHLLEVAEAARSGNAFDLGAYAQRVGIGVGEARSRLAWSRATGWVENVGGTLSANAAVVELIVAADEILRSVVAAADAPSFMAAIPRKRVEKGPNRPQPTPGRGHPTPGGRSR